MIYHKVVKIIYYFNKRLKYSIISLQKLNHQVDFIHNITKKVLTKLRTIRKYEVGIMIEIPK